MKTKVLALIALAVGGVMCCADTQASTWRVEKDGSGDFTVIQAAVDASASGDTILIGPGRYEEYTVYHTGGTYWLICVWIRYQPNLTLIGSTIGETRIAMLADYEEPGLYTNTEGISAFENENLFIANVTVEGFYHGIFSYHGDLTVEDCIFDDVYDQSGAGIVPGYASHVRIERCEFRRWRVGVNAGGCDELRVEGCQFVECNYGVEAQNSSNANTQVVDCELEDCEYAIGITYGAGGEIRGNVIRGETRTGIGIAECGDLVIVDNDVQIEWPEDSESTVAGTAVWLTPSTNSQVVCTGNIFSSNRTAVYVPYARDFVSFHGNHIVRSGSGYAVRTYFPLSDPIDYPKVQHWDFTQNYWGTTDVEEIAAMILDYHDDPRFEVVVDFQPMADGPIATEMQTWSNVKALWE